MALDFLPTSSFPEGSRRTKRPRLGWDDPDPSVLAESSRLQFHVSAQIFTSNPSSSSGSSNIPINRVSSLPILENTESFTDSQAVVSGRTMQWQTDDKDGHLNFEAGEDLTPRYKIIGKMGEGTFGRVLECWDKDEKELVAIKVVRSAEKYREDAMIEIDVLSTLHKNDRMEYRGIVQFKRWFDYQNHICIVFEKLGLSLYDFLKANDYRPFHIDFVREFGRQILSSIAYMHGLSLIHTDLKPENVLLVSSEYRKVIYKNGGKTCSSQLERIPKSSRIKLIDFGSTTIGRERSYSVISTRHYRAPEVILGSGWSYPCDIWSIGCILVELCSGEVLFQTHENLEHLAMMERVLGPVPRHMIRRASKGRSDKYFRHGRRLNWPEGAPSRESARTVRRMPHLDDIVMQNADECRRLLLDLLQQLLKYDPADRPTARQALEHPFFQV